MIFPCGLETAAAETAAADVGRRRSVRAASYFRLFKFILFKVPQFIE